LKALAIYRDGSKGSQPVSTKSETTAAADAAATRRSPRGRGRVTPARPGRDASPATEAVAATPARPHLTSCNRAASGSPYPESLTHKFDIQGHEGYVTVGFYPDGRPGEVFITMAKEGSTIGGLMDVLGTSISIGLQYGVSLEVFVNKFAHSRFEPAGFTKNPDIPIAKSVPDYIFRWLGMEFIPATARRTPPSARPKSRPPRVLRSSRSTATARPRSPTWTTPRP
jgi:ribonucleoside-diphosphate reductase alpha chain